MKMTLGLATVALIGMVAYGDAEDPSSGLGIPVRPSTTTTASFARIALLRRIEPLLPHPGQWTGEARAPLHLIRGAECPVGSKTYCGDDLPWCCINAKGEAYCAQDTTKCTR
jgi:hypothetical protein